MVGKNLFNSPYSQILLKQLILSIKLHLHSRGIGQELMKFHFLQKTRLLKRVLKGFHFACSFEKKMESVLVSVRCIIDCQLMQCYVVSVIQWQLVVSVQDKGGSEYVQYVDIEIVRGDIICINCFVCYPVNSINLTDFCYSTISIRSQ